MPPIINQEKCIGCGTCADICNSDIFVFDRKVDKCPVVKFPEECWHCANCRTSCPCGAIAFTFPLRMQV